MNNMIKVLPILLILILMSGCDTLRRITDFTDPENGAPVRHLCKVKYEVTTTSNNYNSGRIFYPKNSKGDMVFLHDHNEFHQSNHIQPFPILPWTQEVETRADQVSFGASILSFQGTLTISIYVDDLKVFTKNETYISNELLDAHIFRLIIKGFCYED